MWTEVNNILTASFLFKDFKEAWKFMNDVASAAESMNHHPDWTNIYNRVMIRLNTHDASNTVTDKDRKLAKAIDEIYTLYSKPE